MHHKYISNKTPCKLIYSHEVSLSYLHVKQGFVDRPSYDHNLQHIDPKKWYITNCLVKNYSPDKHPRMNEQRLYALQIYSRIKDTIFLRQHTQ